MTILPPTSRDRDGWQTWIWTLPDDIGSRAQKLQFMQMIEAEFKDFDPFRVVGDLLRRRELWRGVVMDRAIQLPEHVVEEQLLGLGTNLIKLRDIQYGWNVDTLFLLTDPDNVRELRELAEEWPGAMVYMIEGRLAGVLLGSPGRPGDPIVTVWWD